MGTYRTSRRDLFPLVGAAALAALVAPAVASAEYANAPDDQDDGQSAPSRFVYAGTYTAPNTAPGGTAVSSAKGIYVFKMDGATGGLTQIQVFELENPSWVAVDANASHLYATSEVSAWHGVPKSGGITAFAIDQTTGEIKSIGDQPTGGAIPAHVIMDPTGKFALVANYVGANWSVLPIQANGSLGPATGVFAVTGHGANTGRQEAPHPHETLFDPAGAFVFGPDLGTDHLWSWTLNTTTGMLAPNANLDSAPVASGAGPRHLSFHPAASSCTSSARCLRPSPPSATTRRTGHVSGCRRFRRYRPISQAPAARPRLSSIKAGSSSTPRIAGTTLSPASVSTSPRAC